MAAMNRVFWSRWLPWIFALVHVALALLLAGRWLEVTRIKEAYLLSIPCAQLSLIAIWSAAARVPAWLRLPVLLLGTVAISFVFLRANHSYGADTSAGWTVALATQALLVAIAVTLGRLWRLVFAKRGPGTDDANALRYSLRMLLLWTTALAVLLGLGRELLARVGWTDEVLKWNYFLFMPVLGGANALYAVFVWATLLRRDCWPLRMLLGLLFVGLTGASMSFLLQILFNDDGGLSWPITLTWALGQAGILYATLLPLGAAAARR